MAFTYGFYNSLDHDRRYNAEQVSALFDALITDGVFGHIDGKFETTPGSGLQVLVKPGLAWFDHTWNQNDTLIPLYLSRADVSLARYDAVVLEVNSATRTNSVKLITGTPASSPAKPAMTLTDTVRQHPLAYVRVAGGATSITTSDIEIVVGRTECPFATSIVQQVDITVLFRSWENDFNTWFTNLKLQLTDNVVANLQKQIDELKPKALYGTTAPSESLGVDGNTYVKTR